MTDLTTLSDDQLKALYQQPSSLSSMSDDQLRAMYNSSQISPAGDVAKSAGIGLAKGSISLAGLPNDLAELGAREIDRATRFVAGKLGVDVAPRADRAPTYGSSDIQKAVEGYTGEFYKPKTTAGKYAETIGEFAPGLIGGPAGLARRAITNVVAPGLASEAAGQFTQGTSAEPYARVGGALVGGLAPSALGRVITPLPASAERAAAASILRSEGVNDITAGQATGRKGLQYLEAERGAGQQLAENSGEQFTAAALRRVGENQASRATPEVIDSNFKRIGQQFDDLASRNTAHVDQQLITDLRDVANDYRSLVSAPNQAPAVKNFIKEISNVDAKTGGLIPGDTYQSLRSRMETAARGASNSEARNALRGLRESLDDAMERSIATYGKADDLGAWREARNQYRNMLVIERAATGAGEGAAIGLVSPAKLREATVNVQGRRNYARGNGDFADLARSGVAIMSPLPNSGTPGRLAAQNLGTGTSSVVGALLGGSGGSLLLPGVGTGIGGAAGAVAGALVPRMVGHAVTSGIGRRYLSNQKLASTLNNLNPRQSAIIDALMATQQQRLESRK